jgi:FtsZ-binding cell division protein ZapB
MTWLGTLASPEFRRRGVVRTADFSYNRDGGNLSWEGTMSMSSHLLKRAVELWKSGQKLQARKVFETIVHNDRQNESAWIWYIYSLETEAEKIASLETFLSIFPQHALGRKALATLKAQEAGQVREQNNILVQMKKIRPVQKASVTHVSQIRPDHKKGASVAPWIFLFSGLCILLLSTITLFIRYNSLRSENQRLEARNQIIVQNFEQLNRNYASLESEHRGLSDQYNSLVGQYESLNESYSRLQGNYENLMNEHSILQNNYDALFSEHNQLINRYNALAGDYNLLNNIAIKPPYIVVHDRMVDTTFYDLDGQLITWTTPFAGLEYGIEHGSYMRGLIVDDEWKTTLVHTTDGEPLWIRDFSVFVTPTTFQKVVPQLYEESTSAYQFIYQMWYMIGQLSSYATEDTETPRYSLETLLAGGGDCEDLSILLASLIQAAPVDWYVDLVYVDSTNLNNPQEPDHVVVYIDTGQETYIVETTSDQYMLPYTDGITGWLADDLNSFDLNHYPVSLH